MSISLLDALKTAHARGDVLGVTSVCSAHPLVIEAAMLEAAAEGDFVLLEATCNQVNHLGGYTGMTPADFRNLVFEIGDGIAFPRERIILGGDHLGPSPWRNLLAEEAMEQAEAMVAAYVTAGYEKIHLDASMGCLAEPAALPDAVSAERAARLAAVVERVAAQAGTAPRYIVGTEVPTPGGALERLERVEPTRPEAALATYEAHRNAFTVAGVAGAFERVIGLVVQPGVEFGSTNVVAYRPERAAALAATLKRMPGLVFEAHSTDYQPPESLEQLVRDGFAILKVGPGLTFALREALYALDCVATVLHAEWQQSLMSEMERVMREEPGHWEAHYRGGESEQRLLRHFSYSDRIRYYWPSETAQAAVDNLLSRLTEVPIPETLISQFLPMLYRRVVAGAVAPAPRALLIQAVRDALRPYRGACNPGDHPQVALPHRLS